MLRVTGVKNGRNEGSNNEVIFKKLKISSPLFVTYSTNFKEKISQINPIKEIVIYIKNEAICLKI